MVVDLRVNVLSLPRLSPFFFFSGNKIKQGWSKMVDKMKSRKAKKKKMKKMEEDLVMKIIACHGNEEEGGGGSCSSSSREGSIHSLQDSERVSPRRAYPKRKAGRLSPRHRFGRH